MRLLELIDNNPGLNLLPLLEMLVQETPEYLEAFCNQAIFTVAELLREGQPSCCGKASRAAYCPAGYWKSSSNCTRGGRLCARYAAPRPGRSGAHTGKRQRRQCRAAFVVLW